MDKMLDIEDCHAREIEDGKPVCTNTEDRPCPTPECKETRRLNAEYIDELSASEARVKALEGFVNQLAKEACDLPHQFERGEPFVACGTCGPCKARKLLVSLTPSAKPCKHGRPANTCAKGLIPGPCGPNCGDYKPTPKPCPHRYDETIAGHTEEMCDIDDEVCQDDDCGYPERRG